MARTRRPTPLHRQICRCSRPGMSGRTKRSSSLAGNLSCSHLRALRSRGWSAMRTMHVRFDVAFVAVVTVALLAATPAEAGKGSAMCGAYERVDVSLLADPNSGDFSRCKYGHRATDEEQGKNCISRPAFSCNFCTRHAKYSKVKNHTCACIDETKRDELRQNTDATRMCVGLVPPRRRRNPFRAVHSDRLLRRRGVRQEHHHL